ncbi:MAG: response regulator [Brumimicrobium sp.]|nr:response regulator [Brumimicrobium sp.]
MHKHINVLYIDDERSNLTSFKAAFRRNFNIFLAESAHDGLDILKNNQIHVILTDQRMPEKTGVEFLSSILEEYPHAIRILVTGYTDMDALVEAVNKGHIFKYISKPWDNEKLKEIIIKAYEVYKLQVETHEINEKLSQANEQLEFMLRQKLLS